MYRSKFNIPKMDCPSEENLVRMAFGDNEAIKKLEFDLQKRTLFVVHSNETSEILAALQPLNFGATLVESSLYEISPEDLEDAIDPVKESKVLKSLLVINGVMFLLEIVLGIMAESMGLISDSLDMLADAAVYGVSLYVVGKSLIMKKRAAKLSGYLQMILALSVLAETFRRFYFGSDPEGIFMIGVAFLALIANVSCLFLLYKHKGGQVHMKASWIFSTNDVIANIGVILAGVAVLLTNSPYPDLVIGTIVGIVVLRGAFSILRLAR